MQEELTADEVQKLLRGEHVAKRPSHPRYASTITSITITVPLPPEGLHSNARVHWRTKARLTAKYRNECAIAARAAVDYWELPPCWKLAECECTFYMPRRRDTDGLIAWMKSAFDGLQGMIIQTDSGLIHGSPKQITGKAANGERKVELRISERKQ